MMTVQSFKVRSLAPNKVSITRSIDLNVLSVRAPAKYAVGTNGSYRRNFSLYARSSFRGSEITAS